MCVKQHGLEHIPGLAIILAIKLSKYLQCCHFCLSYKRSKDMMALQRLLCPFSMIFLILFFLPVINIPRYECLQDHHPDPLHNYPDKASAYDASPQAYPHDYITKARDSMPKFNSMVKLRWDVFSLKSFEMVGNTRSSTSARKFSVADFGAKADGADDTEAFEKAWKGACSTKGAVLVVPDNNYVLKPVTFRGPCKSDVTFQIYGTIEASGDRSDYEDGTQWLFFDSVKNLLVEGGGTIDGNGRIWWQNSCKINKNLPCKDAPTAVTFYNCNNLVVKNLKIQNSQQFHISFDSSKNVQVSNLEVTSPAESPNTDGIHVTATQNIQITKCVIATGDDCISIISGSQNVKATDITCGPGHGISIGSLGANNSKAYVSRVTINGAKLSGTTNGVRIKTWQGGSGTASNIKFQNIEMDNVTYPIIIDQYYCDQPTPCKEQSSAVQVKNVVYRNIKGTSASDVAIKFDCSKSNSCQGILLQNVDLETKGGVKAKAACSNAKLAELGTVSPQCP